MLPPATPPPASPLPLLLPPVPRRFASLADADASLAADQAGWRSALTPEQRGAIARYKDEEHHIINTALRAGEPLPDRLLRPLDGALGGASLPYAIEVWRGAPDEGRVIGSAAAGAVFPEPAFLSTTLDRTFAEEMASWYRQGVVMRILIPAAMRGVGYTHPVAVEPGTADDEYEVLLRRGLRLQVVERSITSVTLRVPGAGQ